MLTLSRRGLLFGAILIVGFLLLACGDDGETAGKQQSQQRPAGRRQNRYRGNGYRDHPGNTLTR